MTLKNLFLVSIALAFFASLALALPTITFCSLPNHTYYVGQDLNIQSSATGTGTITYGYDANNTTDNRQLLATYLTENWNDGEYTSNPIWTVASGTWTVGSQQRITTASAFGAITTPLNLVLSDKNITIQYDINSNGGGTSGGGIGILSGAVATNTGYFLENAEGAAFTRFFRVNGNASDKTTLLTIETPAIVDDTVYNMKLNRTSDGNFSVYIDNVYKGSVVDTTYTTASFLDINNSRSASHLSIGDINVLSAKSYTLQYIDVFDYFQYTCSACDTIGCTTSATQDFNSLNVTPTVDKNINININGSDTNNRIATSQFTVSGTPGSPLSPNPYTSTNYMQVLSRFLNYANRIFDYNILAIDTLGNYVSETRVVDFNENATDYNITLSNIHLKIFSGYPKNELTNAAVGDYNLTISGALDENHSLLNSSNEYIFPIVANQDLFFTFSKNGYFSRTYYANSGSHVELSPYLISEDDGAQVVFYVKNPYTIASIPGVEIKILKGATLVEDIFTDSAGVATAAIIPNTLYYVQVYQDGQEVFEKTITGLFTSYTIYLYGIGDPRNTIVPANFVNVSFLPAAGTRLDTNSNYVFSFSADANSQVTAIRYRFIQDDNTIVDTTVASPPANFDVNVISLDINSLENKISPVFVIVDVNFGEYVQRFQAGYFIGTNFTIIDALTNLKGDMPFAGRTLIVLFLTIVILGMFTKIKPEGTENSSLGLVALIVLGFFTVIGFLDSGINIYFSGGVVWDASWGVMLVSTLSTLMLLRIKKV